MSGSTGTGAPFPPPGPTTLQVTIKSYLYDQYTDDDALQTFVAAFNIMQTWILAWWIEVGLPYWPGLFGALLDWIGAGLYGYPRPTLSYAQTTEYGGYATAFYGQIAYAEAVQISNSTLVPVNDDIYQRMLTWHLYLGDGWQFNFRWLKQRVHRFLNGANGVLPINDNTYDVSVIDIGEGQIEIRVTPSPIATILQYAIMDGVLALPQQYQFSVANLPPAPVVPPVSQIVITRQETRAPEHYSEQKPWVMAGMLPGIPVQLAPPVQRTALTRQEQAREGSAMLRLPSLFNPPVVSQPLPRAAITRQEQPPLPSIANHGVTVWPGNSTTYFTIKSGNIIDPHGNVWEAKGINVLDNDIPGAVPVNGGVVGGGNVTRSLINSLFSNKINLVRLACGGDANGYVDAQSNTVIQNFVNDVTNNGAGPIVVLIENHDSTGPPAYTGAALAAEQAWYQALAILFRNNPYVMFGSMNEPGSGAVSAQHQATVNTIRGVGNNTLIGLCVLGGWDYPDNSAVYSSMHGVFLDCHFYNWQPWQGSATFGPPCADPTNQSQINAGLTNYIDNFIAFATTLDGPILVLLLEVGFYDYAHDPNVDVHGANGTNQVVISGLTIGLSVGRGCAVWLWAGLYTFGNTASDCVNQTTNALTDHGTVVAANL